MQNIVLSREIRGYNFRMSSKEEKKSKQILVNVGESVDRLIDTIAKKEDRPAGYVVRELMLRGLTLYMADGILKDSEIAVTSKGVASGGEVHVIPHPSSRAVAQRMIDDADISIPAKHKRKTG
jgi:hypothetical protein